MSALIHPTAIIEDGAELGAEVEVGAYTYIGQFARIGDGCRIASHVSIRGDTSIGAETQIFPFAALGEPPQSKAHQDAHKTRLVIGARNMIREHVTMQAGTEGGGGVTKVGDHGFFMVGAHIAHDCAVGDRVTFANNATLGGHVHVGDDVNLGGAAVVLQRLRLGRAAMLGGAGALAADLIPFAMAFGNHAKLEGLNIVGLRRQGASRDAISSIRTAYERLFLSQEKTFRERVDDVSRDHGDQPAVAEIVAFIQSSGSRPVLTATKG